VWVKVVMNGSFGMRPKKTMAARALPMAKALVARGHHVTLLLPPWSNPEDSGRVYEEDGVRIENIDLPARFPLSFHYLTTRRLVKRASSLKPDVIHCFKPKAYAGLSAYWIWQLKRLHLANAHLVIDTDDWEGAGGWNDLERYSWAQRRAFAWQEQWGLRHCDALSVASRALESIVWSMGIERDKVVYVPNGVEVGRWKMEVGSNLQLPSSNLRSPVLLLYTRFFEFKIERILAVFARVLESMPQTRLRVIGKGLFGEEEELLAQAKARGWEDRVRYDGWIQPERLPVELAQADAAIYPLDDTLINRAKCAMKLIDLLSAGVPVVADAVGQNIEYVRHNETGLLVPSGDVDAMANAVAALLNDRGQAQKLGDAAAHDVRDRFGWDRLVERVECAYGWR
jgi:glycosyltransferase involved in cell wall biosynthesis